MVYDLNVALGLVDPDPDPVESTKSVDEFGPKNESNENSKKDEVVHNHEGPSIQNVKREDCSDIPANVEEVSVKIEKELDEDSLHKELVKRFIKKEYEASGDGNPSKENSDDFQPSKDEIDIICKVLEEKLSLGSKFPDLEKVYLLYCEYARIRGFSVRKSEQRYFGKGGEVRMKMFHCSSNGVPSYTSKKHKLSLYKKLVIRTDCKARLVVAREDLGPFIVVAFDIEHNHDLVRWDQTYLLRSSRNLNYAKKSVLDALTSVGIGVHTACKFMEKESGGVQNVGFTRKDAYHHMERKKMQTRVEDGDAWMLVDYLTNKSNSEPFFWWKYQLDDDGRILNIFWRDTRCVVDYDAFGDVLSFDTTFRTNKYNLVAAPFVGINHHTQNVLFGMALMSDETTSSFMWLFETFLESMHGRQPKMIFTDQCRAMMNAIDVCFPKSKHRLCQWHISRNCTTNFLKLNGDASFKRLWHKCMNIDENEEEFDSTWREMMSNYEIENPSWYRGMHDLRHRWSSAFSRGIFSAGLLATSRSESTNSALKKVVQSDIPIIDFVRHLDEIQDTWRLKESAEDTYSIWRPGQILDDNELLTHAATVYTSNIYKSFEFSFTQSLNFVLDEISRDLGDGKIEFIARDKRFPELYRTIIFHTATQFASCSCGIWETEGMVCPHIIKVFDRRNVSVIPESLILRRWTKGAKNDIPIHNKVKGGLDTSLLEYMTFASTTMRHLYEMVSTGFKHPPARDKIIERMKNLKEEFSDIMSSFNGSGEEEKKIYTTPGGQKFRNPNKVYDRRFANVRKPLTSVLKVLKRSHKRVATKKPTKKARKCSENNNSSKEATAGPKVEPDPLHKYYADDPLCKLSL